MYFVVIGVLLLVMKVAEFGVVAEWSWWGILSPFAAAVVWWAWADATGYTKRREMDKMDARQAKRRQENLAKLGMDERGRRGKRR
ncbi:TIGR04438 family Trp-rich protein [Rhizobacter sp. LjRoot28]|jgi:small Trp-rich protein|uniref:TIGR04438 family Trp-rich protein n=1 Tax=Rhizobacter sp. LjRoot28 TaxID=3342309 RepID=UPI003ECC6C1E